MNLAEQLYIEAQKIADATPGFNKKLGPGNMAGNGATNAYLTTLNAVISDRWPTEIEQQVKIAPGVKYSFDFYIPSEKTAVEIALSLRNIVTEFEKDIFKAILADQAGNPVKKLVLIGKQGAVQRQNGTGPNAIKAWVCEKCGIEIEVRDLALPTEF